MCHFLITWNLLSLLFPVVMTEVLKERVRTPQAAEMTCLRDDLTEVTCTGCSHRQ